MSKCACHAEPTNEELIERWARPEEFHVRVTTESVMLDRILQIRGQSESFKKAVQEMAASMLTNLLRSNELDENDCNCGYNDRQCQSLCID
jgi:hypothetical protein